MCNLLLPFLSYSDTILAQCYEEVCQRIKLPLQFDNSVETDLTPHPAWGCFVNGAPLDSQTYSDFSLVQVKGACNLPIWFFVFLMCACPSV